MRRTLPSALVAFYPAVVLVAVSFVPEEAHLVGAGSGRFAHFLVEWWFAVVVLSLFGHSLCFV